ncbi:hypothetical protein Agub_g5150, partial [Astrephomene gubernaculifera]
MAPKNSKSDDEGDERAPWEDGALMVDVTSVAPELVLKNCLSNDLPSRLAYLKGLAAAAPRCTRRELTALLDALGPLLEDEALGVRLAVLREVEQLAKLASSTASPEEVREAVLDALESQIKPSISDVGGSGGGGGGYGAGRRAAGGVSALPMVREAQLATLDAVCGEFMGTGGAGGSNGVNGTISSSQQRQQQQHQEEQREAARAAEDLLMRLYRTADVAVDKLATAVAAAASQATGPGTSGRVMGAAGGIAAAGGGGGGGGDGALMVLSVAAVAVRHMAADRGGLQMAGLAGRLRCHGDTKVREALATALPQLYGSFVTHPGGMEELFSVYEQLVQDPVWCVRQACARVVAEISRLCGRVAASSASAPDLDG